MHEPHRPASDAHPTSSADQPSRARSPVVWLLLGLLSLYGLACVVGWPQGGRDRIVAAQRAEAAHEQVAHQPNEASAPPAAADDHGVHPSAPPPATTLPFVLLLAAIAIFPLTPGISHWWEHNHNKLLVAGLLAAITLGYYTFLHHQPVDLHFPAHALINPAATGPSWPTAGAVLTNALCAEYIPFIALLFALYVVTGGVRIEGDLVATPTTNATFLALGAAMASFIGTTGAAMLLVRPLLETNKERKLVAHTLVFFIFMVCNCGGLLLPIGDPPLFLGYLEGVDFLWTRNALVELFGKRGGVDRRRGRGCAIRQRRPEF